MKFDDISKRGLILGIISCVIFSFIDIILVVIYFLDASGKDSFLLGLLFLGCFAFILIPIIIFILHVIFCFKDSKGKGRLLSFIPTFVFLGILLISISVCGIHYQFADKVTFGIPLEEQEKLSIENMYNAALEIESPDITIQGDEDYDKKDNNHLLIKAFYDLNPTGPIEKPENWYTPNRSVTYSLNGNDFYGFDVYEDGYIKAMDYGDILAPSYELFYQFDSSLFEDFYQLALSI